MTAEINPSQTVKPSIQSSSEKLEILVGLVGMPGSNEESEIIFCCSVLKDRKILYEMTPPVKLKYLRYVMEAVVIDLAKAIAEQGFINPVAYEIKNGQIIRQTESGLTQYCLQYEHFKIFVQYIHDLLPHVRATS